MYLRLEGNQFEVMRDSDGKCYYGPPMENFDPVGVHTGDLRHRSYGNTADKEYQMLRSAALNIISETL